MKKIIRETRDLTKKANGGDVEAMYSLACTLYIFASSPEPLLGGYDSALDWARQASEHGHAWAATLAGHILSSPENPSRDMERALLFYKKAEALGHSYASECIKQTEQIIKSSGPTTPKRKAKRKRNSPQR